MCVCVCVNHAGSLTLDTSVPLYPCIRLSLCMSMSVDHSFSFSARVYMLFTRFKNGATHCRQHLLQSG